METTLNVQANLPGLTFLLSLLVLVKYNPGPIILKSIKDLLLIKY